MAKTSLLFVALALVAVAFAQRGDMVDPGFGHPPPHDSGEMGGIMKHVAGAVMDFIGAEMYGDRVFKKLTVIMTPEQQAKYSACAKAALTKVAKKEEEYAPVERKMLLDEVLGQCMIKAKYNWDDEKVEKLECCTIQRYFKSMLAWGSRRPGHIPTPPGFRMVEAEFDCVMEMAYGFNAQELKTLRTCGQEAMGLKSVQDVESKYAQLLNVVMNDQEGMGIEHAPKYPTEQEIITCLKKAKPNMPTNEADDVAFLNTKKREVGAMKAGKIRKADSIKRLLALLQN